MYQREWFHRVKPPWQSLFAARPPLRHEPAGLFSFIYENRNIAESFPPSPVAHKTLPQDYLRASPTGIFNFSPPAIRFRVCLPSPSQPLSFVSSLYTFSLASTPSTSMHSLYFPFTTWYESMPLGTENSYNYCGKCSSCTQTREF